MRASRPAVVEDDEAIARRAGVMIIVSVYITNRTNRAQNSSALKESFDVMGELKRYSTYGNVRSSANLGYTWVSLGLHATRASQLSYFTWFASVLINVCEARQEGRCTYVSYDY